VIVYRAPCARRLRTIEEVDKYLAQTNSHMTIDMFCFDSQLHTDTEYVPVRVSNSNTVYATTLLSI